MNLSGKNLQASELSAFQETDGENSNNFFAQFFATSSPFFCFFET